MTRVSLLIHTFADADIVLRPFVDDGDERHRRASASTALLVVVLAFIVLWLRFNNE